jgi:hypothetical protein
MNSIDCFVIFNVKTEKYSKGGSYYKWGKTPKVWASLGHLRAHLTQFKRKYYNRPQEIPLEWVVVVVSTDPKITGRPALATAVSTGVDPRECDD